MKIRAIITGATGMVGEGILHECLLHDDVEAILMINRKPSGIVHPKIKEILHADFADISALAQEVTGYNACFFCAGVSSIGKDEKTFYELTYTLTTGFAYTLSQQNPEMVFCYVSGSGTNSTGKMMWARVKGKTENDLFAMPFKKVYAFRPGFMKPTPGLKNTLPAYKYINWLYRPMRALFPASVSTLKEVGLAMIHAVTNGYDKQVLEVKDIVALAKK
jgi:uncharacterized protein YbjT (DUF2867 family)